MNNSSKSGLNRFLKQLRHTLGRRRSLRDDRGSALVEVAFVFAFLGTPMLMGTVAVATMIYASIEVSNAAHAGAMYGMMSSTFAANTAQITGAAQAEASDFGANLVVTPTSYYACSAALNGAQFSSQSAANTACTGVGNHSLQFIQVATRAPLTLPFHWPGLPSTVNLNGFSVMEVEE